MPPEPPIRASDQDRERTASQLREHHALGRLDAEEFHERLDKVFEARTIADLDELTADLPAVDLYPLPTASLPRNRPVSTDLPAASILDKMESSRDHGWLASPWRPAWASWTAVVLICAVLALVSSNAWPLLLAAAVGVMMGAGWAASRRSRRRGGPGQPRDQISGPGEET